MSVWTAFKTALVALASSSIEGGSHYDDEDDFPMAQTARAGALDTGPTFPPAVLPPEAHNNWGTMPDYTFGMPDD